MAQNTIVLKFGGTSVQNAEAMSRVADIVADYEPGKAVVVTSAISQITNMLLQMCDALEKADRQEADRLLAEIEERHRSQLDAFAVDTAEDTRFREQLNYRLSQLRQRVAAASPEDAAKAMTRDRIVSLGELLSSVILTAAFRKKGVPARWFDARDVMLTNNVHGQARPLEVEMYQAAVTHLQPVLEAGEIPVTQGFIGRGPDGQTTTLGRGGSDYTAALLGAALGAEQIEIWTDVNGVMTTDPRIAPAATKVEHLSFAEAAELAYFGAKVLHPATLLPAMQRNIPVIVRNTNAPADLGTRISREGAAEESSPLKSIACKRGITVINISSARMLMAHGFLRRVFTIFDDFETSVDLVSTSEVSVSVTIDDESRLGEICRWLQEIGTVEVFHDVAIVCLVSSHMRHTSGMAARIFSAVKPANILMISQGASELNLSFVIENQELDSVVRRLHAEFFE